jgi:acyl-CoA synthetase (AMP-forming)/AMP-acid ligase II
MGLSEEVKQKIHQAHFVRGIAPSDYLVKYRNMFELLQYRTHLQPDDVYMVFYPEAEVKIQLTYKEFISKAFKTANLLKSRGIKTEDRVATVSHNHLNTIIQYFAAWSLGATVVPINVNEEPERIKYILESSGTRLAFVNSIYLDKILQIQKNLPALKKIFVYGNHAKDFNPPADVTIEDYEESLKNQPDAFKPGDDVGPETESLIVYTSGTTGLPKGVVLTQYNLLADADGIAKWHKMEKGQTMMCVLPIHHVNGTVVTHITPMYYGGKAVLNQKFHTRTFFERLAKEKVQVVSVVPTLLQFLCHDYLSGGQAGETGDDKDFFHVYEEQLSASFRHIICGAGPLTCELALKFENMFGLEIMHGYGLSETTCYSCFLPITLGDEEHTMWLGEFGFPSIGVEIEPNEMDIHNPNGESVPEGERGEIVIRGHNVMKYYLHADSSKAVDQSASGGEANAKTFEFGWFRSGDEGFYKKDSQGRKYFFITGRIKELIIRGGVNIAPLEIDEVLMSLPEVKAGIAVGFENDWYGEEVGALVLLKEDILAQKPENEVKASIIRQCREKLPAYKSPKVVVLSDTIPVTSTGKYQRNKVKHLFEEFKKIQFK